MLTARLYIAALEAEEMEGMILSDPRFSVMGSCRAGERALKEIENLCPDALILDQMLPGLDGPAMLERLSAMPTPPRTLMLLRAPMLGEGTPDETLPFPFDQGALLAAIEKTAAHPLPALAAPWEETRRRIAGALLDQLAVSKGLKGRAYMQSAAAAGACAPLLLEALSGGMYPYLARLHGATPGAVEKAIRTAVEHTWLHGDLAAIQALFGFSVDADRGKPTNAEFLAMLSEHTRRAAAKAVRAT